MKYQKKCSRGMTWLMPVLSCVMLLLSCSRQECSRFVFHSSEEAVAACHMELAALREIKEADVSRLIAVVADWLTLQDSVYNYLESDTTIQLNTSLTTDYYTVSDSIREEIVRIARLQPRSLHDVTHLKIHTARERAKTRASQDFKNACELFDGMERTIPYSNLTGTVSAYNSLLDTTVTFSKENEVVDFLRKEDRCFRSLMTFLNKVEQQDLAAITSKTSRLFDDLYGKVAAGGNSTVSTRITLLLTMRFNRRIIQNAEACMRDINENRHLSDQQKDNYRWMLIQPFMSIDSYSMASLTDKQEKTLLQLADELPSLFASLDNRTNRDKDLHELSELLSDFLLSTYLKSLLQTINYTVMKKNKKKAFKMRSDFEKAIELEKTMANYTEEEIAAIEEWLDMLDDKLRKVSLDAMLKFARDKGQVQAFLIGLARFTYRIIKDMEDFGLSAKGNI